jgi:ER degradation enhancer, mannosidase alpha-like 1
LLSIDGKLVVEDLHPSPQKLVAVSDGYILQNLTGVRAHIVSRMDGKGYDITKRKSLFSGRPLKLAAGTILL